ncbi:hypothetical protein TNCT_399551 [Trichonephila clavata]|uniref:Uncharacterized protein n=1 Tax=Trichonephila clavata TaxID=2740835 RepID=A0A8X6GTT0_TRICU|nr:hypothetical protein TNCT_399551 [Trichonephila clavata]
MTIWNSEIVDSLNALKFKPICLCESTNVFDKNLYEYCAMVKEVLRIENFEDSDKMRLFVSGGVSSSEGWNPKVSLDEFQNKPNTLELSLESLENSTRVS